MTAMSRSIAAFSLSRSFQPDSRWNGVSSRSKLAGGDVGVGRLVVARDPQQANLAQASLACFIASSPAGESSVVLGSSRIGGVDIVHARARQDAGDRGGEPLGREVPRRRAVRRRHPAQPPCDEEQVAVDGADGLGEAVDQLRVQAADFKALMPFSSAGVDEWNPVLGAALGVVVQGDRDRRDRHAGVGQGSVAHRPSGSPARGRGGLQRQRMQRPAHLALERGVDQLVLLNP